MHRSQACADLRKNVDSENTQVQLLDAFRCFGGLCGNGGGDGVVVVDGVGQGEAGGVGWGGGDSVCVCAVWKHVVEEGRGVTGACLPPCSSHLLLLFCWDPGLHLQAKAQPHPRRAEPPQGRIACPASLPFFPCVSQPPCPPVAVYLACAVRGRARRLMWDGAQVSSDPVNYLSRIEHEQRMAQVSPLLRRFSPSFPPSLPPPRLLARVHSFPLSPLSRILLA